ncbi:unnamed protein product [Leptidea sinapis]|uniref:Uncharacterized protein n=1 Tax=Leptidea sinapis TaxID=189913 RepID=A0A5E4R808_9NEOP|nr:unnamed protein product [Leptidea sinapis]
MEEVRISDWPEPPGTNAWLPAYGFQHDLLEKDDFFGNGLKGREVLLEKWVEHILNAALRMRTGKHAVKPVPRVRSFLISGRVPRATGDRHGRACPVT